MGAMGRASWIDIIEVAYDVEAGERAWLEGILRASDPLLNDGLGLVAYVYDASRPHRVVVPVAAQTGYLSPMTEGFLAHGMEAAGPEYIRATYRSLQVETSTNTPGYKGSAVAQALGSIGVADMLGINGMDPSGVGVWLGAALRRPTTLGRGVRSRFERIASHLAIALRLRRRIAATTPTTSVPWSADAVLTARGAVVHVESDEARSAREQLRTAAVAIDRARGKMRCVEPDEALGRWMGLADGRWSLVDKFDVDGKRYVLARRNEANVAGLELLTARERAVAGHAALGHTNKVIAYELGIAHSTVRVLLRRAASKLGVRGRDDLAKVVRAAADATLKR